MSIAIHERIEHTLALETLSAALAQAKKELKTAKERIKRLEIQLVREGWTQCDLDWVDPKVEQ